ncbi:MAG: dephospho-CoA kinase [Fusobacteriaceae bacterium]
MILGLTGGIACGKTTISNMFKKIGIEVVDADVVAREVLELPEVLKEIRETYGDIIFENDKLDRKKMRDIIFNNKDNIKKLNSIVHPKVIKVFQDEYNKKKLKEDVIVFDIPLLFEVGLEKFCDKILVVYVKEEVQIERIMRRDGSSRELAKKIIDAQMNLGEKIKLADYIIENSGTIDELEKKIKLILSKIER